VDRGGVIVLTPRSGMPMTVHAQDRHFTQGVEEVHGDIRMLVNLRD